MTTRIPQELREALAANPDKPLRVEDDETNKVYVMVEERLLPTLWEDYVRREVERGLAAADRGELEPWDVESVKAEGRQVLEQRRSQ